MTTPSTRPGVEPGMVQGSEPPKSYALDPTLAERFGSEVELCVAVLSSGIVALESESASSERWEEMMRTAHSLKGAARVCGLMDVAQLAHALEDYFVATRATGDFLHGDEIDRLLETVDLFQSAGRATAQGETWTMAQIEEAARTLRGNLLATSKLANLKRGEPEAEAGTMHFFSDSDNDNDNVAGDVVDEDSVTSLVATTDIGALPDSEPSLSPVAISILPARLATLPPPVRSTRQSAAPVRASPKAPPGSGAGKPAAAGAVQERVLRVAAESIDRLMGLAGESLVESRRVATLSKSLTRLKREHSLLTQLLVSIEGGGPQSGSWLDVAAHVRDLGKQLVEHHGAFDDYMRRVEYLGERLYREALKTRMRPFSEGAQGLPRLVRDVSRNLGKRARLRIVGEHTEVDRDVLESLEAPLNHLLRNALDHGIEDGEARARAGKPEIAELRVEARHRAGMLAVALSDDGRGIDPERIRGKVIERGLVPAEAAANLRPGELFEFLFLPGFSTAAAVSEISGRGVGLDVVRTTVAQLGGSVQVESTLGRGTTFHLLLPVTRSVLRALVAEVDGEAFAFPLLHIERIDRILPSEVRTLEGQRYTMLNDRPLALVSARAAFGYPAAARDDRPLNVVVISHDGQRFGIAVDEFRGEHDLVVRPLDVRLGKVEDITAAAVLVDGTTALIVDVDDLVRSVERMIREGRLIESAGEPPTQAKKKRVLVVDDSITVREAERQVLTNRGYGVDVAVDGFEGLHAARRTKYDLIVTDIDMPRMSGIELVRTLKEDEKLRGIPVIIVSYKNREEDRRAGLEAGADHYLSKSSFHDDRLIEVIEQLLEGRA